VPYRSRQLLFASQQLYKKYINTKQTNSIFFIFFINTLGESITGNLTAYVTSAFAEHELTATTSIVSSIMAGVMKLPIAQMINGWGRAEGFSTMVFCTTLGI